jgi:hypothetical protein
MHPKVLSEGGWKTVRRMVRAGLLESWTLCGGTGLALQFGHRHSEDLDLFRHGPFDSDPLIDDLSDLGPVSIQARSAGTLHLTLGGLRVSFLQAQASLLFPGTTYRGLRLADPRDIALMKLVAIGGRGSRKDFVDLYFYLKSGDGLENLFALMKSRFERVDYNEQHLLKSLVWFEDAEAEPMPRMTRLVSWEAIKEALTEEVRRLS